MRRREGDKEKEIITAAISVFAEDGYFDAKMHRIADRAGIGTGTVYLYFSNKEKILLQIFESVWGHLFNEIERILKRNDMTSIEKFNAMIDSVFDYFTSNPSLALVFVNEQNHLINSAERQFTAFYAKTLELSEELVMEGIRSGLFNENLNAKVFSSFFFGGLRFLLNQWALDQQCYPLADIRQNMKWFVLHGIQNHTPKR